MLSEQEQRQAFTSFIQREREILSRQPSCWLRSKKNVLRVVTLTSLAGSLSFFLVTGYLIWATVERSVVLFSMAVLFFIETLWFVKYFVDMLLLKKETARWHLARSWVPLVDLVVLLFAVFFESLLLPCGALADYWHQVSTLEPIYFWMSIQCIASLSVKLVSAVFLTTVHYRTIKSLLGARYRIIDPTNYPQTQDIELHPSAPLLDESDSI